MGGKAAGGRPMLRAPNATRLLLLTAQRKQQQSKGQDKQKQPAQHALLQREAALFRNLVKQPIRDSVKQPTQQSSAHLIHARWHSSVSVLAAMTWQPIASNSRKRSLKAIISVGHTNVKSCGRAGPGL